MGEIVRKRRQFEIKKKQARREKLQKLRERYHATRSRDEKQRITAKMTRMAPDIPLAQYLAEGAGREPVRKAA